MTSKRKLAVCLLIGVPLVLHGQPLDKSSWDHTISTDLQIDTPMNNTARVSMGNSTRFELLRPKSSTAVKLANPMTQSLPERLSEQPPATVLF